MAETKLPSHEVLQAIRELVFESALRNQKELENIPRFTRLLKSDEASGNFVVAVGDGLVYFVAISCAR